MVESKKTPVLCVCDRECDPLNVQSNIEGIVSLGVPNSLTFQLGCDGFLEEIDAATAIGSKCAQATSDDNRPFKCQCELKNEADDN